MAIDPYSLFDFARREPYPVPELIELIKEYGRQARTRHNHPLAKAIASGRLSRWQLQRLAIEDFQFLRHSPTWHAAMMVNIPDLEFQQLEAEVLSEEIGPRHLGLGDGPGHPELFLRYCTLGLGLTEEEVLNGQALPTSLLCIEFRNHICKHRSIAEAAAVIHIYGEALNIERARQRGPVGGFGEAYPWIPYEAMEFQRIHSTVEDEHAEIGVRILERYAASKAAQDQVWRTLMAYVAAEELRADGIYNTYILNCPDGLGQRLEPTEVA